jgi:hypothetical protein
MYHNIENVLNELREVNELTPRQRSFPSVKVIEEFEKKYRINLPFEYKVFLQKCSDVNYSTLQPGVIIPEGAYYSLDSIMKSGWTMGVKEDRIPFCEDNGDYYCFNERGEVEFWSHDGYTEEKWNSFSEWVKDVWLGED